MARTNQEEVQTFVSITGLPESVAAQKLEEHGGNLNEALNAHFSEGDTSQVNVRPAPLEDFMDIDDPVQVEPRDPPLSLLSAARNRMDPFSLLDESFTRRYIDEISDLGSRAPLVSHPREVREIPIEVKDGNGQSGNSGHGPVIEDITESDYDHGPSVRGTVIIDEKDDEKDHDQSVRGTVIIDEKDDEKDRGPSVRETVIIDEKDHGPSVRETVIIDEKDHGPSVRETVIIDEKDDDIPAVSTAHAIESNERVELSSRYGNMQPSAPVYDDKPSDFIDVEEEMIRAAIVASKRDIEGNHLVYSEFSDPGTQPRQSRLEDDELVWRNSLSLKTAEQEKALRRRGNDSGSSKVDVDSPKVELGKAPSSNGQLEIGSPSTQDEVEEVEQPPIRHRSRHESFQAMTPLQEIEDSPPSSGQNSADNHPQHNGSVFPTDEWGGISSEEHDEAVMLEAAMFGGIPEGTGYNFAYLPHQFMQAQGRYPRRAPRPPSPSLEAQRMIREQQDDEYLASLQADREKEMKAKAEAEARRIEQEAARLAALEEERRKEEEAYRKLVEEQEFERQLAAKEASLPQEPTSNDDNAVTLLVRMPDGSRRGRRFLKSDRLQSLFDYIDIGRTVNPGTYRLVRPYPRRAFSDGEGSLTLNDLGLTSKQEALFLELI